jgi:hypothetical protein
MGKAVLALAFAVAAAGYLGAEPADRILYAYDQESERTKEIIGTFREALAAQGIAFDEADAASLRTKDLAGYGLILVHGIVQIFNFKSPLRDWLGKGPDLSGRKVSLFVTAGSYFAENLAGELSALLRKNGAAVVDVVTMATKDMAPKAKRAAVDAAAAKLKWARRA